MEDCIDFRTLPPSEKVYFWYLLSEFTLRRQFYKSDLEFMETLNLSEIKVRQARRKAMKLGWVKVRPGFISRGKNVATTYMDVTKVYREKKNITRKCRGTLMNSYWVGSGMEN